MNENLFRSQLIKTEKQAYLAVRIADFFNFLVKEGEEAGTYCTMRRNLSDAI